MEERFCFAKMHSKVPRLYSKGLYQFYFRGELTPQEGDITVTTFVTKNDYEDLIRLAETWQGPISAVLHVPTKTLSDQDPEILDVLSTFSELSQQNPSLRRHVDIHLVTGPVSPANMTAIPEPTNFHLNVARLFARTEYVLFLDRDTWPSLQTRSHIEKHTKLLLKDDVLILPTLAYTENATNHDFPRSTKELMELVRDNVIGIKDHGWSLNEGPTDYKNWLKMEKYAISRYNLHYQPNFVIRKAGNIPW
ncbi:14063_t:CDS:2 [Acaulospora colombiana]|uniref:14063_t:CDS:1 n=1 Tax=Acaulospora colombiana TaxID=27376 RepID=A0ACA9KHW7_9GLOM|nr:14063_t:CDS:2 [Acaulospora colombiana]